MCICDRQSVKEEEEEEEEEFLNHYKNDLKMKQPSASVLEKA